MVKHYRYAVLSARNHSLPCLERFSAFRNSIPYPGAKVALTIDSASMPHKVLIIRGSIHVDTVDGIAPEYAVLSRRGTGEE